MTGGRRDLFREENGILLPRKHLPQPNYDFNESAFDDMLRMQREHFWYKGRHKFILKVLRTELARRFGGRRDLCAIDMGGGCGGWIEYLHAHAADRIGTLALGDGSTRALSVAGPVVGDYAERYQIDLLDLPWSGDWDVVFLLDVLEHVRDHVEALREVRRSLKPGGLLVIAVPALMFFWSYNDELAGHHRRYSKDDFRALSEQAGLELLRTDYFMFFLSPALFISRTLFRPSQSSSAEQIRVHLENSHRVPATLVNATAAAIFSAEASLANLVAFPWGTSVIAVLRRPES